jgi:Xaa-Pro aminopeptidase
MSETSLLAALRGFLAENRLQALLIPTADPHLSEYIHDHFALRKAASGFTGSAGTLVVTEKNAALWCDSRYWEQAQRELVCGIFLMRDGKEDTPAISDWLHEVLAAGSKIGVDGRLMSSKAFSALKREMQVKGLELCALAKDPADLWRERPPLRFAPIFEHTAAPQKREEKIARLQTLLQKRGADAFLVTSLDEIAWLLNLRGSDIPHNPVFYSFLWVEKNAGATLFAALSAVPETLRARLEKEGIALRNKDGFEAFLAAQSAVTVLIDEGNTSEALTEILQRGEAISIQTDKSPVALWKAVKTEEETDLIRCAMKKDGTALIRFYAWLEKALRNGTPLTETEAAAKLGEFRAALPGFVDLSFETICAFGPNAALPHYQAHPGRDAALVGASFLLIDSGAQFQEGTTDITRTTAVGEPTEEMKEDYTAVLRAHIRLAKARFPEGLPSQAVDAIAREPLWERLCDYGHGTGHGVGFFLNVHEGPQRISYPRFSAGRDTVLSASTAMVSGMLTSNEPGLYRPGKWGIRIENLVSNRKAGESEFGRFLEFETVTLCPIDLKAVLAERLLEDEIRWINDYHNLVLNTLKDAVKDEPETLDWLIRSTRPIAK